MNQYFSPAACNTAGDAAATAAQPERAYIHYTAQVRLTGRVHKSRASRFIIEPRAALFTIIADPAQSGQQKSRITIAPASERARDRSHARAHVGMSGLTTAGISHPSRALYLYTYSDIVYATRCTLIYFLTHRYARDRQP